MSSADVSASLSASKGELRRACEEYERLLDFSGDVVRSESDFNDSLGHRRRLIGSIAEIEHAKVARAYSECVGGLLDGVVCREAEGAFNELKRRVHAELGNLEDDIERLRREITRLDELLAQEQARESREGE